MTSDSNIGKKYCRVFIKQGLIFISLFLVLSCNQEKKLSDSTETGCEKIKVQIEKNPNFLSANEIDLSDSLALEILQCPEIQNDKSNWLLYFDKFIDLSENKPFAEYQKNSFENSINKFSDAISDDSTITIVHYKTGKFYFKKKNYPRAFIHMNIALNTCRNLGNKIFEKKILMHSIPICLETYDFKRSLEQLESLQSLEQVVPNDSIDNLIQNLWWAIAYQETPATESSQNHLNNAREISPSIPLNSGDDLEFQFQLHQIILSCIKLNEGKIANKYWSIIKNDKSFPDYIALNAGMQFLNKNYDAAVSIFNSYPEPFNDYFNWIRFRLFMESGDYSKADSLAQFETGVLEKMLERTNEEYHSFSNEQLNYSEKRTQIDLLIIRKEELEKKGLIFLLIGILLVVFGTVFYVLLKKINLKNLELVQLNKISSLQNEEFQLLNKKLENFSHTLSHDANAYIDMILNYSSPELNLKDGSSAFSKVHKYARHLKEMSVNIINYHFIEKAPSKGHTNVEILIKEILNEFPDLFIDSIIELDIKSPYILGNDFKLKQVLINLLKNVIRFKSKDRRNKISFSSFFDPLNPGKTILKLKDNGMGIDSENLPRIFDKFYTSIPNDGGTGLGLFIGKEIIEKMGGEIWVESIEGQETTFNIRLETAL